MPDLSEGNRREVTKVKDLILYAFVFVLNITVGIIAFLGVRALDKLDSIYITTSNINTTTMLNTQYIKNVDDSLKRHELADNSIRKETNQRIKDLERRNRYDKK